MQDEVMIGGDVLTVAEVRSREELRPLEQGDDYYVGVDLAPLPLPEGAQWERVKPNPEGRGYVRVRWGRDIQGTYKPSERQARLRKGQHKILHTPCGHKIDPAHFPKSNCKTCWDMSLLANKEATNKLLTRIAEGHEETVRAKLGDKVVKHLKRVGVEFAQYLAASEKITAGETLAEATA